MLGDSRFDVFSAANHRSRRLAVFVESIFSPIRYTEDIGAEVGLGVTPHS